LLGASSVNQLDYEARMASRIASIVELLGLEPAVAASSLTLACAVEAGLPAAAVQHLARALAPEDPDFSSRLVSRPTLQRRPKATGRLTTEEGDRLVRVAKTLSAAIEIYRTPEKAREFLCRKHPMLSGRRPLDVAIATGLGSDLVVDLLGRLAYGGGV
jgi:putative toxin-antitoxin system antitoxin component (TIGR02293 family)